MNNTVKHRESLGSKAFSVSARVAMQLGRESISSSIVAILELVKNAYDADAENVVVQFVDLEDGFEPSVIIQDDGIGMTQGQVENHWMVIGTDNKAAAQRSVRKSRILVGEKGLGRLGLDRLAYETKLQTFASTQEFGIELHIDWRKYETAAGDRLESIEHNLFKIPKVTFDPIANDVTPVEHGTYLQLIGLKDRWDKKDLEKLREELTLLVSPFGGANDFSIWLHTNVQGWADLDGQIEAGQLTEAAEWVLTSRLTEDGDIYHEVTSHEGLMFEAKEEWSDVFRDKAVDRKPRCGPVEFVMYYFNRGNKDLWNAQVGKFLNANQGIRIYRDNFRVKPYGDPSGEGDWLNLALRRVRNPAGVAAKNKRWVVGYNQIVGAVFIERDRNTELLDQTNREGIVEGPAYFDLRRYTLHAVGFFEDQRQKYERSQSRRRQVESTREEAQSKSAEVIGATTKVRDSWESIAEKLNEGSATGTDAKFDELRQSVTSAIEELERAAQESAQKNEELIQESEEQEEEYEEQKNTLGNLASLGILAAAFGHETVGYAKEVIGNVGLLRKDALKLFPALYTEAHHDLLTDIDAIERAATRINTFATFTLGNIQRDKRKRKNVGLESIARDVFAALNLEEVYNIEVEIDFAADVPKLTAFRIDWESIFINLITNAKWAIDNVMDVMRPRKIRVRGRKASTTIQVSFADSGCGVSQYILDRMFEPGYSTKENRRGDVIGTGMGLAIVENFIDAYGGTITVEPVGELGGAEFHIEVPSVSSRRRK